jgi:small subunit ribosomal protein S17
MSDTVMESRKTRKGTVTSTKMDKTITVEVEREFEHPLYVKRIRRDSNLKAHDEDEVADPGDIVRIVESRPTSASKRWLLDEILVKQEEQALEVEAEDDVEEAEVSEEDSAEGEEEDVETASEDDDQEADEE